MNRRARILSVAAATTLLVLIVGLRLKLGLTLLPPHAVRRPAALLDPDLARHIDDGLTGSRIDATEDALAFALAQTGGALHFGLDHPTRLAFGLGDREGNCIEYAHLFAAIFNRAAGTRGLPARAHVVHSARARLFGLTLPMRGFADHDWVLVSGGGAPLHVDPAFDDVWLGWDIGRNVVSPPPLP
jgi:hypothetical protein